MARKLTDDQLKTISQAELFSLAMKGGATEEDHAFFTSLQSAGLVAMTENGVVQLKGARARFGGIGLYPSEWKHVDANLAAVKAFIAANIVELQKRSEAAKAKATAEKAAKAATA